MNTTLIVSIILALAPAFGIEPKVALAVASVESSLNPKAIGQAGEIGLFQIMPDIGKKMGYTKKQLKDPVINTYVGLQLLKEAKANCKHKVGLTYLVCYNYGIKNAMRVKHPTKFPYVKRVKKQLDKKPICNNVLLGK